MLKLIVMAQNFLRRKKGQAMVEYGLIIALIAIVVIVALGLLGKQLLGLFNNVTSQITSSSASAAG